MPPAPASTAQVPHIVHIRPSFGHAGAETRVAKIINYSSAVFRHTIIALDGNFSALKLVDDPNSVACITCLNTRNPLQMILRFRGILREIKPDLVLTYNWGGIDGVVAAQLARDIPIIHTEDGFDVDEAARQKPRRVLMRRLLLRNAYAVVAPSETLARIMRNTWKLPEQRLHYIPNGVDVNLFKPSARSNATKEIVIGNVGNLTAVKRQSMLLEACASLARTVPIRLLIAGEGPLRPALEERCRQLGIAGCVEFLGYQPDVATVYRRFDIFAMSSVTEQMPFSVLEAMASGLPIVSTDVGDIKKMVSPKNQAHVVQDNQLDNTLAALAYDEKMRRELGAANREHCTRVYSLEKMCSEYVTLYWNAIANAKNSISS